MNTKTVDTEAITQRLDNHPTKEPEHEIFGQVIHSYTRAQAIEDGYLIDLTQFEITREHFKYPVACTNSVWEIIDRAVNNSHVRPKNSSAKNKTEILMYAIAAWVQTPHPERIFR